MFDPTLLILLALAALGFISHNTTVAISILVLIIVRVTPLNTFFPVDRKARPHHRDNHFNHRGDGAHRQRYASRLNAAALVCQLEIAGGYRGRCFCLMARGARRYADEQPAFAGCGSAGGHCAGRSALSRRAGGPADCSRAGLPVYREVVVRLAM